MLLLLRLLLLRLEERGVEAMQQLLVLSTGHLRDLVGVLFLPMAAEVEGEFIEWSRHSCY